MSRSAFWLALVAVTILLPAAAPPAAPGTGVQLGGTVLELAGSPDSLWVLTCDRRCTGEARRSVGRMVRIDARSSRVIASVEISRPHAFAVGPGGVYVLDFWSDMVRRLDVDTLSTVAALKLDLPFEVVPGDDAFRPIDIVSGGDSVWVSTARGAVARVDPTLRRVTALIRLPGATTGSLAFGKRGVWVAQDLLGVYRIDPATNRLSARIRIGSRRAGFAVDRPLIGSGLLLAVGSLTRDGVLTRKRGVARIDARLNRLESVAPLPSGSLAVTFGKGSLWVARVAGTSVERINPRTGEVGGRFPADDVRSLAVAGGRVWTADRTGTIRQLAGS